jgi:hypothetical protein
MTVRRAEIELVSIGMEREGTAMTKTSDHGTAVAWMGMLAMALGAVMMLSPAARAGTLRRGASAGSSGSGGQGTFFSGYYDFGTSPTGDNLIRLENPTSLNGNMCAMIYIFDTREEMGECCGCPLTPNQMLHDSIKHVIGSSWELAPGSPTRGVIQIVSAVPNNGRQCSPFQLYTPTPTLNGWITHAQTVAGIPGLTEVALTDNGDADPTEGTFLINLCGAIVGNGSGAGVCTCPLSDE